MFWNLISWYFVLLLIGLVSFPLAFRLLGKLPDRGYGMSRILGLLIGGFIFWLLGNLRLLQNTSGGVLFALAILFTLSVWSGMGSWQDIWEWTKQNYRVILMTELVFIIGFAFMILVRGSDPDATGTEKPMELAFINAIMRSEMFPAHDPWLSGYAISYYHFGYILTGLLAKLSAVSGGVAFNLMLASVFAMGASGAYCVLYNLLAILGKTLTHKLKPLGWAVFGPVFLLLVSNFQAVFEVLHQFGVGWDLTTGTSRLWDWVNIGSLRNPPPQPLGLIPQRFWWWWQSSRVIQDIDLLGNISTLSPIDEFPAFSFVLGDLHPHVLAIPFVMLVVGLALNIYLGGMESDHSTKEFHLPYRLDLFIFSAVVIGGFAFLNTWDVPVYFALLVGAYTLRLVWVKGWDWKRVRDLLILAIPLGIVSVLFYIPFFISFQSQAGGLLPNLFYPTRGLYLWVMFAPLFIPIFLFFGWLIKKKVVGSWKLASQIVLGMIVLLYLVSLGLSFGVAQTPVGQQVMVSQGESTFGGLVISALIHRMRFGFSLVTLAILLVATGALLLGHFKNQSEETNPFNPAPFVLLMALLGGLMVLAPEFIFLRDVFGARMNTIFKFYYQAWMLWSLVAGFAAVVLLTRGRPITKVVIVLVIVLGLLYPVLAFPSKTNQFQPVAGFTLDASAYLERIQPNEAAVIGWLSEAPFGVVAEAIGGQYSQFARVSTHSGQPTVLGWPGHQGQWRGGYEEVGSREGDIRTLYQDPDWNTALSIIRQYDIAYIYVGSLEMSTYALSLEKFDQNLEVGFEQQGVRVYLVPHTLKP